MNAKTMANLCNVSVNTIRRQISVMMDEQKENGFYIEAKSGVGYRMVVNDEEKTDDYFHSVLSLANSPLFENNTSSDYKCNYMIRRLLTGNKPFSLRFLANELMYSESSLRKDLKGVEEILRPYHLKLVMKRGQGLSITGNEVFKRLCLTSQHKLYVNLSVDEQKAEPWFRAAFSMDDAVMRHCGNLVRKAVNDSKKLNFMTIDFPVIYKYLPLIRTRHSYLNDSSFLTEEQIHAIEESGMIQEAEYLLGLCKEELSADENEVLAYAEILYVFRSITSLAELEPKEQKDMMELTDLCIEHLSKSMNIFQKISVETKEQLAGVFYIIHANILFDHEPDEEHFRVYTPPVILIEDLCIQATIFLETYFQKDVDMKVVYPLYFILLAQLKKEMDTLPKLSVLVESTYGIQYAGFVKNRVLQLYQSHISSAAAAEYSQISHVRGFDLFLTDMRNDMIPKELLPLTVRFDFVNDETSSILRLDEKLNEMDEQKRSQYIFFEDLDALNQEDADKQIKEYFPDIPEEKLFERKARNITQIHEYTLFLSASHPSAKTGLYFFTLKKQLNINHRMVSQIVVCVYDPNDLEGIHQLYEIFRKDHSNL